MRTRRDNAALHTAEIAVASHRAADGAHNADSQIRFAAQAFLPEVAFLFAASFCGVGHHGDLQEHSFQSFALIALTALTMGTRNAPLFGNSESQILRQRS